MTNILEAIYNIANHQNFEIKNLYTGRNRANNMGEALENYIKDAFAGTFGITDELQRMQSFNQCSSDLKSLEIIIINEAKLFMQELEKLSDSDFFVFTLKLDSFPKDTNISKMRERLKQKDINSSRKKKVIKKMKTTKG